MSNRQLLKSSQELKHTVFNIGSRMGSYVWLSEDLSLSENGRGLITFEAKAHNDIHVSLNVDLGISRGRLASC